LTNLIANASDELESIRRERPDTESKFIGEILIRARHAVHQDQAGVTISVEDNGPGIPEEIRDKILEAFYTTKPAGKGTGLGLAICSRIISDHNGTLSIARSEELGGASFEVWLPA
jgi:signal transduction histidine kinase